MEVAKEFVVFNKAWAHVAKWEGGHVNNQYDRGGETKYGISQRQYPNIDIKNLTEQEAKNIAYKDYWSVLHCGLLASEDLAIEMFDFGFNSGTRRAALVLQRALNLLGSIIAIDGDLGPDTIAAANYFSYTYEKALLNAVRGYEFLFYKDIVIKNPSQKPFIRGWLARI